ncbi:MAG: bifunctional riboflavin kinase/FAD synthetase [Alphaproteobacteria bacterium]|nr:bifunctional riboflavin kinase/FAD synthetase [Alphaproteobacteria bacterium]
MQIFTSYRRHDHNAPGAVVAIGNFDGVHKGHMYVLRAARALAQKEKKPLAVLTFEPHPRALFRPDDPPSRLSPPDVKAWRLAEAGCDILFSIPFTWDFASQSADDFIQNILKDGLGAAHVVVGYDFQFGQMRKGTPADLQTAGIPTTIIAQAQDGSGEKLASSRIRQLLETGEIAQANNLLGWAWEIWGIVQKGDQRGRALGYPTANMPLGDTLHPAYGIYAAWVQVEGESQWRGAAVNIGIRPMFAVKVGQVESYIFDFDQEIYGKRLRVMPVERLRSEAKFETLDALKAQMAQDCIEARKILGI